MTKINHGEYGNLPSPEPSIYEGSVEGVITLTTVLTYGLPQGIGSNRGNSLDCVSMEGGVNSAIHLYMTIDALFSSTEVGR